MSPLYFVSIRERDFGGETVCAGHFEAATADAARQAAIKEFMRPARPATNSPPSEIEFCRRVNEKRERVLRNGYVAIATRSRADRANAILPTEPRA